jgi:hypothetical protein
VLRYGRVTGERPVRSISPEKMLSVITGELGGVAPVEAASPRLKVWPAGLLRP